jgi:hypothetical protein
LQLWLNFATVLSTSAIDEKHEALLGPFLYLELDVINMQVNGVHLPKQVPHQCRTSPAAGACGVHGIGRRVTPRVQSL